MTTPEADVLIDHAHARYSRDNALPDNEKVRQRHQALEQIKAVLEVESDHRLMASPLGPDWTDVFVAPTTLRPPEARMRAAGWLSLAPSMNDLSLAEHRWAVMAGPEVLAGISFVPPAVTAVDWIARRSRAFGMVTLRDVLELREL